MNLSEQKVVDPEIGGCEDARDSPPSGRHDVHDGAFGFGRDRLCAGRRAIPFRVRFARDARRKCSNFCASKSAAANLQNPPLK